jgi:hypothetical protein
MKAFIKDTGKLVNVLPKENNYEGFFDISFDGIVAKGVHKDKLIFPKFDIGDSVYWYDGVRNHIIERWGQKYFDENYGI